MPQIFQNHKNIDNEDEIKSLKNITLSKKSSDGESVLDEIKKIAEQGGSSAYLLYIKQ